MRGDLRVGRASFVVVLRCWATSADSELLRPDSYVTVLRPSFAKREKEPS